MDSTTLSGSSLHKVCSRKEIVRYEVRHARKGAVSEKEAISRMSPESQMIHASMKWSEIGFIPSFKNTDAVLLKASRRTYEFCKQSR
ncbi:hypothetical protein McpCs1_08850 [Methanocorpusculaceae archaeon Cs1]|uniref:Uncharacterized protein n=1 Tax=Methanorbis rubei TaxID=3028300 RepID=A0AAE4SB75_9EURY|nr:hypothetical protein [Methanocorpusculaceae archaeon Cs1]